MEHPAACSERVGTTIPAPHDLHRVASTNPRSVGASPTVGSRAAWPVRQEPIPEAVLAEPRVSILKIRSNHFRPSASVLVSLAVPRGRLHATSIRREAHPARQRPGPAIRRHFRSASRPSPSSRKGRAPHGHVQSVSRSRVSHASSARQP